MNIFNLLESFSSDLKFYIGELESLVIHVGLNLPKLEKEIDEIIENKNDPVLSEPLNVFFTSLSKEFSDIKKTIYSLVVELQKQDIIQQQLLHLLEAVDDVQSVINSNQVILSSFPQFSSDSDLLKDSMNLYTLLLFLLNSIDLYMKRINDDLESLIFFMEEKFKDIDHRISQLNPDLEKMDRDDNLRNHFHLYISFFNTFSKQIKQYFSYFNRLRILQKDLMISVDICLNIRSDVEKELNKKGGPLSLNQSQFSNTIIQRIVNKLSVAEERRILKNQYEELNIEAPDGGSSITLF